MRRLGKNKGLMETVICHSTWVDGVSSLEFEFEGICLRSRVVLFTFIFILFTNKIHSTVNDNTVSLGE